MSDKEKIKKEIEIVVNRRLNLLNGDYFDLNEETDGFTNEIMEIIDSLPEEPNMKNEDSSDKCPCCGWSLDSDGCCGSCGYGRR